MSFFLNYSSEWKVIFQSKLKKFEKHAFRSYGGQGFDPSSVHVGPGDVINNYPNPEGFTKLTVTCCATLTSDNLYGLFGIVPGLDVIHPISDGRLVSIKT